MTNKRTTDIEMAKYLKTKKNIVDKRLLQILKNMVPMGIKSDNYEESLFYAVADGGKRLRPILSLVTFEIFSKELNDKVIDAACVTELIHAGSLMLDDLPCMDNAQYRRGKDAVHRKYGDANTILTSASLWVESFRILASLDHPKAAKIVEKAAHYMGGKGLVQGQLLDLESFNHAQTISELKECYLLKTGVIFELAIYIGAVLGNASEKDIKSLVNYAKSIGLAYQIRDDIIDSTQLLHESGKDENLDIVNNKPNYVSLIGYEKSIDALNREVVHAKSLLQSIKGDCSKLLLFTDSIKNI